MKNLHLYILFSLLILSYKGKSQCNLDSIGLLPTQSEINNLFAEWSTRDQNVYNWQVISDNIIDSSRIIIASHEIEGFVHYGLIRLPMDTSLLSCPLPVLVYLHGGLNGLFINKIDLLDNYFPPELLRDSMILIAPSFRGEQLNVGTTSYYSGGPSTEMDKDADDAMIFLNGVIENYSFVDTTRISLIGFSRGSNVAYKFAVRSSYVKAMNVFFSATNVFDPLLIADAKNATLTFTSPQYIVNNICINDAMYPYCNGNISLAEGRRKILSWSPAWYAESLPRTNAFHGTLDPAIPITQAYFIDSMLNYNNPGGSNFQLFEYPNGGHSMSSMTGFEPHALELIRDVITPVVIYENDSLKTYGDAPEYQWYWNDFPITGAIEKNLSPLLPGQYKLEFILGNGCSYYSRTYDWLITGNDLIDASKNENILYFNTTSSEIRSGNNYETFDLVKLFDINGRILVHEKGNISLPYSIKSFNLKPGLYFFTSQNIKGINSLKFYVY